MNLGDRIVWRVKGKVAFREGTITRRVTEDIIEISDSDDSFIEGGKRLVKVSELDIEVINPLP